MTSSASTPEAQSPHTSKPSQSDHLTLSVLMTVYHGSVVDQLEMSLRSIDEQTRRADAIVIVQDGPVSTEVASFLDAFVATHPEAHLMQRPHNEGNGRASAAGIEAMTTDLVARQDGDDISEPQRFEKQCAYVEAHPDVALVGSAMREFATDPASPHALRRMPENHADIARYMKMNNPINHPTLMARVDAIKRCGNFRHVPFMEDYDLFARILAAGNTLHNLPEPLVSFRHDATQYSRRTGVDLLAAEWQMQKNLHTYGLISGVRMLANTAARCAYRLLPRGLFNRVYAVLFNRSGSDYPTHLH